jgi:hypothetical protein
VQPKSNHASEEADKLDAGLYTLQFHCVKGFPCRSNRAVPCKPNLGNRSRQYSYFALLPPTIFMDGMKTPSNYDNLMAGLPAIRHVG